MGPEIRSNQKVNCVVAIGGSAGALDAFEKFVAAIPNELNVAFVILQHMDPTQKSLLPEILKKASPLPIELASNGTELQPKKIYIIQPGTFLAIKDRRFVTKNLENQDQRRHPIDIFFKSLADQFGEKAVAVIVSGTGTDGTLGMAAVREAGGRTLVQLPSESKFDGMPRSAISANVVDRVMPVGEIPKILSAYIECAPTSVSEFENAVDLAAVCAVLLKKTGHDFSSYKKSTVARRVERRVQANAFSDLASYLAFLENDRAESQSLLADLLISVTQFFRDKDAFEALEQVVIPNLFAHSERADSIRVWVPACATGQEVYTLAILLKEFQRKNGLNGQVQIFATDIDRAALEFARIGFYPESVAEEIPTEYLSRYFLLGKGGYQAKLELREMCLFSEHSLLKNPPFSRLDLVSCRNLFIYWESELQGKVIPVFHYALNPGGYLFLGPAESVSGTTELFRTIDKKNRIFQKNDVVSKGHLSFPFSHLAIRTPGTSGAIKLQAFNERDVSKSIVTSLLEDFAPPAFVVGEFGEIIFYSGKTGKYLEPPTGAPSNLIFDMIRKSIRPELHALLHKCIKSKVEVFHPSLTFEHEGSVQRINLTVRPMPEQVEGHRLYLIVIQEVMEPKSKEEALREGISVSSREAIVQQLEGELRETREHLQSTIEEVKSSNEELLSMNEELQSANEELQTSKEELQSTNEELETVNAELFSKVEQLDISNSDLHNFFNSAQVPIVFLDRQFKLQRFTPAAKKIFRLIPGDVGRKVSDITSDLEDSSFANDFAYVLATLQPLEREVSSKDLKVHYIMRVSPYRTVNDVIDGVIVTFSDVTELKNAQDVSRDAHKEIAAVIESMSDAFFSVDKDWKIDSLNSQHVKLTKVPKGEQIGKNLLELFFSMPEAKNSLYWKSYHRAMSERVPVYFEDYYPPLDFWLAVSVYPKPNGGLAFFFRDITEEKLHNLKIESERQKLEAVFAQSPAGMSLMRGPNLIFEKVNKRWTELISPREYIGKTYEEANPDVVGSEVPGILKNVFETGVTYTARAIKLRLVSGNNVVEDQYFDFTCVQVLDGNGKPYGIFCHTLNVTDRILSQHKIEESDKRFQQLANSLPQMVWSGRPDGTLDYYNDRWYEFTGFDRKHEGEESWGPLLHPDEAKFVAENWFKSVETGNPYQMELRFKDKATGDYRWYISRALPIRDESGKIVRWYGSSTDIDQQKRAEQDLQAAREELHDFLMQAPIGIALLSTSQHVYTFLNPQFMRMCFGDRPTSEFVGKSVREALPELAGQGFYDILDGVYRTGKTFVGSKIRASMKQADGNEKEMFLNFTYQAKHDSDGRINGILAVIYEVTDEVNEQKEFQVLNDNLRNAIVSRDTFMGIASHELNTPLTSLKLQAQMNKKIIAKNGISALSPARIEKFFDSTLTQVERLALLVNDMLDVSRISSGKLTMNFSDTNLSVLVANVVESFIPQLESVGCKVVSEITPGIMASLDAARIEQVLTNFVTNAIKYAPGKPVFVRVNSEDGVAKVSVRDSGDGIATENLQRIFGRFERATTEVSGLGLGLYICKQIIDGHGGKIDVESAPGAGSTFYFEIPLAR